MSHPQPEDAATVLEQFVHDVANVPAEITHLLEEIQAKDLQMQALKDEIAKRDNQLQKWVRNNGGHVPNPKEEAFSKTISDCYDKCEILQAEKCGLADRAQIILDRQIKRLDIGLRSLAQTEQFPSDWNGPSLLTASSGENAPATGMPLQVVSGNIGHGSNVTVGGGGGGGAPNVANAALIRLNQTAATSNNLRGSASGTQTPSNLSRSQREGSSEVNKRRRIHATLGTLPMPSSNLRQSSLGPGTPKAGTPGPSGVNAGNLNPATSSSRAGSAQPSRPGANTNLGSQKKAPPTIGPASGRKGPPPSKRSSAAGGRIRNPASKKSGGGGTGDRRRQLARGAGGGGNSPSTNASVSGASDEDDDGSDEDSTSPTPSSLLRNQGDGAGDSGRSKLSAGGHAHGGGGGGGGGLGAADDDDGDDDQIYCICQKVSFGDMVGCDNDNCQFQWFHYKCVGVTEEPVGEWLCPTCRNLPRSKLRITKD